MNNKGISQNDLQTIYLKMISDDTDIVKKTLKKQVHENENVSHKVRDFLTSKG